MHHNHGLFILVRVMVMCVHLLIPKHATEAAVVNNCTCPVHSAASCDKITYEQVYNILTKSENSFNIESALYPPKSPSSVRVLVNVYGPKETNLSTPAAKYIWSISCLYAALPAKVLEFWSLGAIQVNSRTQELNITISLSSCDVTKGILKKHIEDALAALEDLAIKPTVRDPRLNSAECVMEGHESDIIATGHGTRIYVVIGCSIFFSVLGGPYLALIAWQYQENQTNIVQKTMDFVCIFSLSIIIHVDLAMLAALEFKPVYVWAILLSISAHSITFFVIICCYSFRTFRDLEKKDVKLVFYLLCANLVAYHFCWLVVGVLLNPIWGIFHLLGTCLIVGVSSYYVYQYYYLTRPRERVNYKSPGKGKGDGDTSGTDDNTCYSNDDRVFSWRQPFYWSFSCIFATICLLIVAVLTGQPYNGKETTDELLRDVVGYLIPFCFAWLCWKNSSKKKCTRYTSPPENPIKNLQLKQRSK